MKKQKIKKLGWECLKHGWEYSRWEFSGWEFSEWEFSMGSLMSGNFPGGSFPDTLNYDVKFDLMIFGYKIFPGRDL